jgi:hypothetical protein
VGAKIMVNGNYFSLTVKASLIFRKTIYDFSEFKLFILVGTFVGSPNLPLKVFIYRGRRCLATVAGIWLFCAKFWPVGRNPALMARFLPHSPKSGQICRNPALMARFLPHSPKSGQICRNPALMAKFQPHSPESGTNGHW